MCRSFLSLLCRLLCQSVLLVAEVCHDPKASAEGAHVGTQGCEGDHIEFASFDSRYAGLADTHDVGDLLLGAVLLGTNLSQVMLNGSMTLSANLPNQDTVRSTCSLSSGRQRRRAHREGRAGFTDVSRSVWGHTVLVGVVVWQSRRSAACAECE